MKRIKWLIGIAFTIGFSLTIFLISFSNLDLDLSSKKFGQDVLFPSISLVSQMLFLVCIVFGLYWINKKHKNDLLMTWMIALSFLALGWNLYFITM